MKTGTEMIRAERKKVRMTTEDIGYVAAAQCYHLHDVNNPRPEVPDDWPWKRDDWKPSKDRKKNLAKAGALYLSEADRIRDIILPIAKTESLRLDSLVKECAFLIDLLSRVETAVGPTPGFNKRRTGK